MPLLQGLRIWVPAYPGAKLFAYAAGTTTKIDTYTSSALSTPNANPVVASADGLFGNVFLSPNLAYKFVLAPSTDTDPPTNPIYTVDNATSPTGDLISVLSKTGDYTVQVADGNDVHVVADASLGDLTITVYTSVGNVGRKIHVTKVDATRNRVFVVPQAGQSWGGTNERMLMSPLESTSAVSDGPAWNELSRVGDDVCGGVAGETLAVGNIVYLSMGYGALTAGRWYKTDADLRYASADALEIGVVRAAGVAGQIIPIRTQHVAGGFSGLVAGALYYCSATAGGVTVTPPAFPRFVGVGMSTAELAVAPNRPRHSVAGLCEGRLTLTTALPVTTSDVTAAGTLYFTPYVGNQVSIYNGVAWIPYTFTELSLALTVTSGLNYDVFLLDNNGPLALEIEAWASDTARTTALVRTDGWWAKTGALGRRYLGTIRASGSNVCEDSFAKRFVWNAINRVARPLRVTDPANSWSYNTSTMRQANGNTANQLDIVVGLSEDEFYCEAHAQWTNDSVSQGGVTAIGDGVTNAAASGSLIASGLNGDASVSSRQANRAAYLTIPGIGRRFFTWLEYGSGSGTQTWHGDNNAPTLLQSGIHGLWRA